MQTEKTSLLAFHPGIIRCTYRKRLKKLLEKYGFKLESERPLKTCRHYIYTSKEHGRIETYEASNWFAVSAKFTGYVSPEVEDEACSLFR